MQILWRINHIKANCNHWNRILLQGPIRIEFFPDVVPRYVNNFISLANKGFYDETLFHRIDKGFVIKKETITQNLAGLEEIDEALVVLATQ
jgi:cyclophilin family peptidyl-prolyl cis-trans isomerase